MIKRETVVEAMYNAIRLGATKMPPDIRRALQNALAEETDPMAKKHLEVSLQNADLSEKGNGLVCADTGFPMFFIHAGSQTEIEGGFNGKVQPRRKCTADWTRCDISDFSANSFPPKQYLCGTKPTGRYGKNNRFCRS